MNLSMPLARSFSRSPESVSEACEVAITSGPLPVNSKAVFMERLLDELHDGKQWYDHSICLFYQNHHRGPSPKRWLPPSARRDNGRAAGRKSCHQVDLSTLIYVPASTTAKTYSPLSICSCQSRATWRRPTGTSVRLDLGPSTLIVTWLYRKLVHPLM